MGIKTKELDEMVRKKSERNQKILDVPREPTVDNPFMNPILNDFNTENAPYPVNADDEVNELGLNRHGTSVWLQI